MYLADHFAEAGVVGQRRAKRAVRHAEDERLFRQALAARTEFQYSTGKAKKLARKRMLRLKHQIRNRRLRQRV